MTEDKEAIEAIARLMTTDCALCDGKKIKNCGDMEENGYCGMDLEIATKILQTLTSLGYVKLAEQKLPEIVCLCGSTRFSKAFQDAQLRLTLEGKIVLTIGCNMRTDTEIFGNLPEAELKEIKIKLDELHKRKIDLANSLLILNVGGYIGESTRSEIEYAKAHNKVIKYLEPICSK